jgi:hypothetical protein
VSDTTTVRYRESLERDVAERERQLAAIQSEISERQESAAAVQQELDELRGLLDHVKEKP